MLLLALPQDAAWCGGLGAVCDLVYEGEGPALLNTAGGVYGQPGDRDEDAVMWDLKNS